MIDESRSTKVIRDATHRGSEDHRTLEIIGALEPRIRGYLRRALGVTNSPDSLFEDIVQAVFLELTIVPTPGASWPIALGVMRKAVAEEKRRRRIELHQCDRIASQNTDLESSERRAYLLALWEWEDRALDHLTPRQRAALELHEMDNISDRDIAAGFCCSEASVRVLRCRAKRLCRELIDAGVIPPPALTELIGEPLTFCGGNELGDKRFSMLKALVRDAGQGSRAEWTERT